MINYCFVLAVTEEGTVVFEASREISALPHSLNTMTLFQFTTVSLNPGICTKKFTFERGG